MTTKRHTMSAEQRTMIGKEVEKLRRAGETPGIVYGPVIETPVPVQVDTRILERMYINFGSNLLIDLKVARKTYTVYMRNLDMDRLRRRPRHIEFYAPNLTIAMTADVPFVFTGEPGEARSVITHIHERIQLQGLPEALPAVIEVDLSALKEIGDSIRVADLSFPDDIEVLLDAEELVVRLDAPQVAIIEEEEAEAAEEAGEATEEAAAEESAEE